MTLSCRSIKCYFACIKRMDMRIILIDLFFVVEMLRPHNILEGLLNQFVAD